MRWSKQLAVLIPIIVIAVALAVTMAGGPNSLPDPEPLALREHSSYVTGDLTGRSYELTYMSWSDTCYRFSALSAYETDTEIRLELLHQSVLDKGEKLCPAVGVAYVAA